MIYPFLRKRTQTHTEEKSCEDTRRRQTSTSQAERSQEKPTVETIVLRLLAPEL